MKTIIIHADDAGLDQGANDAICELITDGIVHSTSLLSVCASAADFVSRAGRWDIGLHAGIEPDQLRRGGEVVYRELERQWAAITGLGVRPSHIDCHAGMIYFDPDAIDAYFQFCVDHKTPPLLVRGKKADKLKYVIPVEKVSEQVERSRFYRLDDIWLLYTTRSFEEKLANLDWILYHLEHGVSQVIVHPNLESEQGRWDYEALKLRASTIKSFDSYNWKKASLHWNLFL